MVKDTLLKYNLRGNRWPNSLGGHVRLVVGIKEMTFEGQKVTWEQLPELLENVPNRSETVFELAVASDEMTVRQMDEARGRAMALSQQFGFEYLSYVGKHPLGSK